MVVVDCDRNVLLDITRALRSALSEVNVAMGVPLDLLFLTSREFHERPLREMDELVPLYDTTIPATEDAQEV